MANQGTLTPAQERSIAALMTAANVREAARIAKVGERSLHRWLRQPDFLREYNRVRAEAVAQAMNTLQRIAHTAVVALGKVLIDQATPAAVVVQAANVVLSHAVRGIELTTLQQRLAELEHAKDQPPEQEEEQTIVTAEETSVSES